MGDERACAIGERLRALRKGLGLSQEQFSEKLSLSQNQISRLENGENLITTDMILLLNDLYGIDPSYLLLGKSARGLDDKMESFLDWYLTLDEGSIKSGASNVCENLMSFTDKK